MQTRFLRPRLLVAALAAGIVSLSAQQAPPTQLAAPPDVASAPADAIVSPTGLASKVLTPGTGKERPTTASTIKVHYTGWTTDGQMFDSSVTRGEQISFGVTRVIRGWTEGVQLMVVGEKRRFWIPAALAYGDNPREGAPKGMLVFDVELFAITTPADAAAHLASYKTHQSMSAKSPYALVPWQSLGPTNQNGAMTSIAVADVGITRNIYVGSAGGGVWKSQNRGVTWRQIFDRAASTTIGDVAVSSARPTLVWVGTGTGIYKSIDAGRTWAPMGLTDTGTITRIVIHPTTPDVVYVAAAGHTWTPNEQRGVFKTTDGGKTWSRVLYGSPNAGAVDLVMDPKDPNALRVTISQGAPRKWGTPPLPANTPRLVQLATTDAGATWAQVPAGADTPVAPPPTAGRVWIDPKNPKVIYTADAGGFSMSTDGGVTTRRVTGIRAAQVQAVELDARTPFRAYASMVDGSRTVASIDLRAGRALLKPLAWQAARDDIRPTPPTDSGLRSQATAPTIVSAHSPTTLYAGYQQVYRSRDRGTSWERISEDLTDNNPRMMGQAPWAIPYQTITQVAESPLRSGLLYAGTDDGNLHVTRDDGRTWTNIGRNLPMAIKKWVSRIVPSQYAEGTVFVAQRGREDDDAAAYVWKSTDYGMTWTSLVSNIPSGSINVVREDPALKDVLYVGNDFGVYVSTNGGRTWDVLGSNLPSVRVSDLQIHPRDSMIVVATYGRGLWAMDARKVRAIRPPAR
jgi:photosystem II stability/assembly factor-like uncharacterized protein